MIPGTVIKITVETCRTIISNAAFTHTVHSPIQQRIRKVSITEPNACGEIFSHRTLMQSRMSFDLIKWRSDCQNLVTTSGRHLVGAATLQPCFRSLKYTFSFFFDEAAHVPRMRLGRNGRAEWLESLAPFLVRNMMIASPSAPRSVYFRYSSQSIRKRV